MTAYSGGYLRDGESIEWDGAGQTAIITRLVADGGVQCGRIIRVPVRMMDGAIGGSETARVNLTDAECQSVVARAKMTHDLRHAYLRDRAPAFTAAAGAAAIQAVAAAKNQAVGGVATNDDAAERAKGAAIAARHMMIERISSGWKGGAK